MSKKFNCIFITTCIILLFSCTTNSNNRSPQDTIKRYERFVQEMKADSIAQLFTENAEIGHENQKTIRGRDSIFNFLSSFKNVKMISNHDSVVSVFTKKDSATIEGIYNQSVLISGKDSMHVSGKFTANLVRNKREWLIWKMKTRSM